MKKLSLLLLLMIFSMLSCKQATSFLGEEKEQKYLFLYTNDEHGHIWEKKDAFYKAVALYEMWEEEEQSCVDCIVLRISGGDSYTGSAISSIFKGESTAHIMREIGYNVSVIGNHEFDYGIVSFDQNRRVSGMQYLASNIMTHNLKPAFDPSIIFDRGESRIGVVGVTTEELKQVAFNIYLNDVRVVKSRSPVARELRNFKDDVDLSVVIAHQGLDEAATWAEQLEEDEKPLIIFNGHEHESYVKNINDILFVQAEKYLRQYARVEVLQKGKKLYVTKAEIKPLKKTISLKTEKAKKIKRLIDNYILNMERVAGKRIARAKKNMPLKHFKKILTCSWLEEISEADIALCNPGAFRDEILKGVIKKSDIISMLPFENRLVLSKISGKQLRENLALAEDAYCGIVKKGGKWFVNGEAFSDDKIYTVVVNEFMYNGGDYFSFTGKNITNIMTSKTWRKPVIKLLIKGTNQKKSIEDIYQIMKKKYNFSN